MSKPYGCALVWDSGLFPFLAAKLAESFETVYFFTPYNAEAFPCSRRALWGMGLPGVTRVNDFFEHLDDADLVVFSDLGQGDLQVYLRNNGYRVFGAGASEILEQDRAGLKRLMLAKGMNRPPTWLITGTEKLETFLREPENEDCFLKVSEFRGDSETMHHKSWFTTEPWLTRLRYQLGPIAEHLEFVVEKKIDGVEPGFDGICIDGHFPAAPLYGWENKDVCYLGKVVPYDDLPEQIKDVNNDLSPVLAELQCRSLFSTEVRVDKSGTGYLIDATLRTPSPPGGAILELYGNIADVIYCGAAGEIVEAIPKAAYVAELVLRSEFVKNDFLALRFPEEYRHLIKIHGHAIIDGVDYSVAPGIDSFCEAVGLGDTLDEAIEQATEVAESIEGQGVDFELGSFDELKEKFVEARRIGIPFD